MARPAKDRLRQNARTKEYLVRWVVPPRLVPIVGKGELLKPLGTKDYEEAKRQSYGPLAEFQAIIEAAARQLRGEPEPVYKWPAQPGQPFTARLRRYPPPLSVVAAGERYLAFMQREQEIATRRRRGEPELSADFDSIIEAWITHNKPRKTTLRPYRSVMRQFAKWLKHSNAHLVTKDKINEYKTDLLKNHENSTVKNNMSVIKGLFKFASENSIIGLNPAATITIPPVKSNKRSFTYDERKRILVKAREAEPLIRWAHWIAAFSGARLSEITTAETTDVRFEGPHVVLHVSAERAKNGIARDIPLHSSIIREGFLSYWESLASGPLFPNRVGWNHSAVVNAWLRSIEITDKQATYHCHRHTFYSFANELIDDENPRIPERFSEAICGHSSGKASRKYGSIPIATLASYVERIPDPALPPRRTSAQWFEN